MTFQEIFNLIFTGAGWILASYFTGALLIIGSVFILKVLTKVDIDFEMDTSIKSLTKVAVFGGLLIFALIANGDRTRDHLKQQIRNGNIEGYSYQTLRHKLFKK